MLFLTKKYPFRILYLPTQIQMVIVNSKIFKDFLCTNINDLLDLLMKKQKKYV